MFFISSFPDPLVVFFAAVITTLALRQIITIALRVRIDWGTCFLYAFISLAIPFLMIPINGLLIGAGVVFLFVRRVNRRDDPRFVKPPAPTPSGPSESN